MQITTVIFDLDDTLYPASFGLWPMIRARMERYMLERMHFSPEEIPELRRSYTTLYGTTMRGLQLTSGLDVEDFLAYVHDVPVEEQLRPTPGLRETLAALPQRKVIFTNADRRHANRVLHALNLEGLFDQIADVTDVQPYCKPWPEAFTLALHCLGEPDPARCLFVDDSPRNLEGARAVGIGTLLVGPPQEHANGDTRIPSLLELPRVLDELENPAGEHLEH